MQSKPQLRLSLMLATLVPLIGLTGCFGTGDGKERIPGTPQEQTESSDGFVLVFSDEFNEGSAPSAEKWNIETGYGENNSGWGNNEWQLYTDSPDNVRVEGGNLVIEARCDTPPCGVRDDTITSGRINTLGKFDFRYGRVEARIKPPVGEGAWPAFWSLGANFPDIGWPRSGEIDFMEMHNAFSDENTTHFTMHWCDETIQAPDTCSFPDGWIFYTQNRTFAQSLGNDFHVFSAEWDAEKIVGKIDGITYFTRTIDPGTMEEFLREFFLILNVATGGTLGSDNRPPSGNETWPQTMLVDYVRVYQREEDIGGGGGNLFIDFENGPYAFNDFEGGVSSVIDNPESGGINTSASVAQLQKFNGAVFAGSTLIQPVDLTAGSTFNMKVFSRRPVPVLFKLEDGGTGVERTVMHSGSGWENLNFDFSSAAGSFTGISFIFELGTPGDADNNPDDWTFYIDDIELVAGDTGGGGGGATSFDFEPAGGPYIFSDFEGGVALVIANPQSGGINTSANVAEMRKFAGAVFAGSTLQAPMEVPMGSSYTIKVWSQRAVRVLFKLEGAGDVDAEVELTHAGGGWQEMLFEFPNYANTIEGITVIFDLGEVGDAEGDAANWTFYIDDIALVEPDPGSDLQQIDLPITFDNPDVNYTVVDFGAPVAAMTTIVADPEDAGNNVASTVKPVGAPVWAGTTMSTTDGLASSIPFSASMTTIGVRVYSPDAGIPVRLKAENLDASVGVEVEVMTTVANAWETLVFDFADPVAGTAALDVSADYRLLSIFFNFGTDGDTAGAKTYLWDDVEFGVMPPVVDEMPPMLTSVSIVSSNANTMVARAGDTVTLTLVANEAIMTPMVMIAGAAADTVVGAGVNWQATKTLSGADANGVLSFDVAYADLAGNPGMVATMTTNGSSVTLDTMAPTVTIENAPLTFTSLDPITLTFQFNEGVTGFALADISVTNGTKSALASIDAATYTASVRPSGNGNLIVSVSGDAALDVAGNLSVMAAPVTITNELAEVPLDVVSIASNNANPGYAREDDIVTIELTAPGDILEPMVTIAGEPADTVTGMGAEWQATRTMLATDLEGEITFEIDFDYADGNPGLLTSGTTDNSMVIFDVSAPEPTINGVPGTVNAMDSVTVTFSFNEDVIDFDVNDITVANGMAADFMTVDSANFTADITAEGNGDLTVSVAADAATDLAGNGNLAASETATLNLLPTYQMLWSDSFTGSSLNALNWTARTDADCPPPCDGAQTYLAERVIVAGNVLSIEARNTARGGPNFTSGLVDTLGKRQLKYGKVEIDATMPGTQGTLPSLWLLPVSDDVYGAWPQSGQIDIVNAPEIGVAGDFLEHATRYGLPEPEDTKTGFDYLPPFAPNAAVHTYAIEWNATEIRWYVDGVNVATQTPPNWYAYFQNDDGIYTEGSGGAPFDQPFYLLMGLAMDTNAGSSMSYPQTLTIEEVRVFECANPDDADLGTGCITGTAMNVLTAEPGPYVETLPVFADAPAVLDFFDPQAPTTPVSAALVPGTQVSNGAVVNSNPAASDGGNTVWNLDIAAEAGTGSAVMRAADDGALSGFFNLTGGETAGELLFSMRVNSATAAAVNVALTGDTGSGSVAVPITDDGVWRDYSVKIGDIVTDSAMNAMSLDLATVVDLFSIGVTNGSANLDLDNISAKVACRDPNGCSAQARLPTVATPYAQDFEGLDIMGTTVGDNWKFFVNVFTNNGATYQFGYGGNAPNGTGQISGIVAGEGGVPQGMQQLSVFSDYNCCNPGNGHQNPNGLVETNVFQEPRPTSSPITAADVGQTWTFSYDAKRGNLAGDSQAVGFFKVLDPADGFSETAFVTADMTAISTDWMRYTIELTIGDWVGQILQYGYQTNASVFEPSGIFYDNVELKTISRE